MPLHHWPNSHVPWRSFHNHWIVRLVEYLNADVLPAGFQARPTELLIGIEPDLLLLQSIDQPDAEELRKSLRFAKRADLLCGWRQSFYDDDHPSLIKFPLTRPYLPC